MFTMRKCLIFAVIPVVFILDRITKHLITSTIELYGSIDLTSFFSIVHARNTGGVFGFLHAHQYAQYIFTFLPVLIACVLVFIIFSGRLSESKTLALSFILAGAVGNIYDRFAYGNVVDFLDFYYGNYHWPAFNVADMSITLGIGLWFYLELFHSKKDSSPS